MPRQHWHGAAQEARALMAAQPNLSVTKDNTWVFDKKKVSLSRESVLHPSSGDHKNCRTFAGHHASRFCFDLHLTGGVSLILVSLTEVRLLYLYLTYTASTTSARCQNHRLLAIYCITTLLQYQLREVLGTIHTYIRIHTRYGLHSNPTRLVHRAQ